MALILIAAPSLAKGPSSATISGPGIDEPMELVDYTDTRHSELVGELMGHTGIWYGGIGLPDPTPAPPESDLGPAYELIWLPHDIKQTLYLKAEGGPLVHTPEQPALNGISRNRIGWVRAPAQLIETLVSLGVPVEGHASPPGRSPLPIVAGVSIALLAASRFMNSRLRPVVSNQ